jgi:hypothetical protein
MPDLDDYDPNTAYDVAPHKRWPDWWTVKRNGIPVWHASNEAAERYATDPEHREAMARKYLHERR